MMFSVTVENAVDTGVGTQADILALGHPPSFLRVSWGPINNEGGGRGIRSREGKGGNRRELSLPRRGPGRGIKYGGGGGRGPLDGGGKRKRMGYDVY